MTKQTLTALYDNREYANNAVLQLRQAGIPDADVTLSPETASAGSADPEAKGFWASLEEMFFGYDDRESYAEGVRRGGILLTAHVDDTKVDEAADILDQHGSIDLTERETTWRTEGWAGTTPVTGGGARSDGTGPLRAVSPTETKVGATSAPVKATTLGIEAPATRTAPNDVLQVVEEELNVGKRAVNRGKVRLRSYVVETPVSEAVTLRDEKVSVERRPVDRTLGAAELAVDAFKDRTIEMEEIDEEAVVGKTVRVVEEVGIRKDATDTVHTINDTVRSTKVDIDDGRTAEATSKLGLMNAFASQLTEEMEVVGSDEQHVGVIDHIEGSTIKLKKMDPAAGGQHHFIPVEWIDSVTSRVKLKTSAADAKSRWTVAA